MLPIEYASRRCFLDKYKLNDNFLIQKYPPPNVANHAVNDCTRNIFL